MSDIYAPVDGVVAERNEGLDNTPETVNSDPFGAGWLVRVTLSDGEGLQSLLTAAEYESLITAS